MRSKRRWYINKITPQRTNRDVKCGRNKVLLLHHVVTLKVECFLGIIIIKKIEIQASYFLSMVEVTET